jgi:hypothetical protein
MRGFSSLTICCTDQHGRIPNYHRQSDTPEQVEPEAIESAVDFAEQLVRRIDSDLMPSLLPSLGDSKQTDVAQA